MVKQISDNEMYLLIKYIKSVLWGVAKFLSYIEEARCLKVNNKKQLLCSNNLSLEMKKKLIKSCIWSLTLVIPMCFLIHTKYKISVKAQQFITYNAI